MMVNELRIAYRDKDRVLQGLVINLLREKYNISTQ